MGGSLHLICILRMYGDHRQSCQSCYYGKYIIYPSQPVNLKPLKLSNIHGAAGLISSIPYKLNTAAVDMQPGPISGGRFQGLPSYNESR